MEIRSCEDIKRIDDELASLFLRPDEAVNWIYAVENGIKEWIGKHNKQYWEIVRHVSEQRGILGKIRKDNKTVWLKREDFACILLRFCPKAFEKGETVSALKSSMEHYEFAADLKKLNDLLSGHVALHHIREVEDLLDNKPLIVVDEEASMPTLEDLLEKYLRLEIDEQTDRFPLSRLCIRPQYYDISPAISVETYISERFLDERRPSYITAYEFVDGVLEKNKLYELMGQYQGKQVKLYIVSSHGLRPDVRALATDRGIGYVLLNPNSKMTSENYVLPRSIEDYTKRQHDLNVLAGIKPMATPLLIMDDSRLTSSLTDVLSEHNVVVKGQRLLNIPYLTDDEIENCANAMTDEFVETKTRILNQNNVLNVNLSLDPFGFADSCGLNYGTEKMEDDFQLGCLDVENDSVILNSAGLSNRNRYRFTMAHELGHYILHSPIFKEQGVVSIGESASTLSIGKGNSRRLEYQANKFASCLLMPEKLVLVLYASYYDQYVRKRYGGDFHPLYYNPDQRETWQNYNNIVGNMSKQLGVSSRALCFRLQSLGWLIMPD